MPLSTRRSSTRGTPRGLFGNNGWIVFHSNSVRSYRAIAKATFGTLNHFSRLLGIVYEYAT